MAVVSEDLYQMFYFGIFFLSHKIDIDYQSLCAHFCNIIKRSWELIGGGGKVPEGLRRGHGQSMFYPYETQYFPQCIYTKNSFKGSYTVNSYLEIIKEYRKVVRRI